MYTVTQCVKVITVYATVFYNIHVHFEDQYKQVLNSHKYPCKIYGIGYLSPLHEYRTCFFLST